MAYASDSRLEYDRHLHRVLSFIDARLGESLDLKRLAREANFSAFHFHRIFTALTGETVGAYLTRRRVEVAAARLLSQPRLSVLSAALDVGFASSEAFTRAFKRHFGSAPSVWRARTRAQRSDGSKISQVMRKGGQARSRAIRYGHGMATKTQSVKIITRPDVRIAYLRYQGPFGAPLNAFWRDEVFPWLAANGLVAAPKYGISRDDPQVTAPDKCRYEAGVEVDATFVASRHARIDTVAGGRYACLRFKGMPAEMPAAWDRLLRDWLPDSGYQLDNRPLFEYYGPDCSGDENTGECECDLCVPLTKL